MYIKKTPNNMLTKYVESFGDEIENSVRNETLSSLIEILHLNIWGPITACLSHHIC